MKDRASNTRDYQRLAIVLALLLVAAYGGYAALAGAPTGGVSADSVSSDGTPVESAPPDEPPRTTEPRTQPATTQPVPRQPLRTSPTASGHPPAAPPLSLLEHRLAALGLVDVQRLDPTIACELKYTTPANIMGEDIYGDVDQCFLLEDAARRLAQANAVLRQHHPELHLVVGDALRPREVQRRMWALVKDTPMQPYVANPDPGSMHNHGAAVDITIADRQGVRLDMGTPLDHFGPETQVTLERHYREKGVLSDAQVANRLILREVMTRAGFFQLAIEWWHYDAWDKYYVRQHFPIIESWNGAPPPR